MSSNRPSDDTKEEVGDNDDVEEGEDLAASFVGIDESSVHSPSLSLLPDLENLIGMQNNNPSLPQSPLVSFAERQGGLESQMQGSNVVMMPSLEQPEAKRVCRSPTKRKRETEKGGRNNTKFNKRGKCDESWYKCSECSTPNSPIRKKDHTCPYKKEYCEHCSIVKYSKSRPDQKAGFVKFFPAKNGKCFNKSCEKWKEVGTQTEWKCLKTGDKERTTEVKEVGTQTKENDLKNENKEGSSEDE